MQLSNAEVRQLAGADSLIVIVAGFKGGIAKSTSAIHVAAYLSDRGKAVLVDGDPNRSATGWSRRGVLPFAVVDERQAVRAARDHEHVVIDTPARPNRDELASLVEACDFLILPTLPNLLDLDALMATAESVRAIGPARFKVLLTICPPRPSRDADEARAILVEAGLPVFAGNIRRAAAFAKAAVSGVVVRDLKDVKAAECWADYEAVGSEMLP